ncbi:hypothetical protein C4561_04430 [candidate division WWE3 bacterium]|jgi:protein-tyrosine-phosphatase|uniref:Phosphotyrosine protein phosphatase I domain-containing protein n=1 Tax=candidate division WWE3 bacterium TaxID=2053526 RepID=A0A3A4ZCL9_UNCKA|nr:MAG: hypothetical protein C4561_04430 [candidate division WWE3 bacterium]
MKIHFVCSGNTFRSRLAEAYLRSRLKEKNISNVEVSSSGTDAQHNSYGPAAWYTLRILHDNRLISFMSPNWKKTTRNDVEKSDLVVFMKDMHLQYCKKEFNIQPENYLILDIDDVFPSEIHAMYKEKYEADIEIMKRTDAIFKELRTKIDKILESAL